MHACKRQTASPDPRAVFKTQNCHAAVLRCAFRPWLAAHPHQPPLRCLCSFCTPPTSVLSLSTAPLRRLHLSVLGRAGPKSDIEVWGSGASSVLGLPHVARLEALELSGPFIFCGMEKVLQAVPTALTSLKLSGLFFWCSGTGSVPEGADQGVYSLYIHPARRRHACLEPPGAPAAPQHCRVRRAHAQTRCGVPVPSTRQHAGVAAGPRGRDPWPRPGSM